MRYLLAIVTYFLFATPEFVYGQIVSKKEIDMSNSDSLSFYGITYLSDHIPIHGILIEPAISDTCQKLPIIIFNRGGNRNFAIIDSNIMLQWLAPIAKAGYIIIASQYRGSLDSDGNDEFGGKDINDILNIIPLLKEIPTCDTAKIGMYGWSRGGMMTYIALTKTNRIKAAVVGDAPTNLFELINDRPKFEELLAELIPDYKRNKDAELKNRSAIFWPEKICPATPLLIIHGKKDNRISYIQSQQLSEKLTALGRLNSLLLFDADHIISEDRARKDEEVIKWFDKYLK